MGLEGLVWGPIMMLVGYFILTEKFRLMRRGPKGEKDPFFISKEDGTQELVGIIKLSLNFLAGAWFLGGLILFLSGIF